MIEIIIVCFIVGLALIMTIRWLRKKVRGEAGDCCNSRASSSLPAAAIRQPGRRYKQTK